MHKSVYRFAFCILVCAWSSAALAGLVTISASNFSLGLVGVIGVTPFDPALGTLDSVNVTINGQMAVSGATTPRFEQTPGGPVAVPYPYQVTVTQDFERPSGQFFAFDTAAIFTLPGVAQGAGEPFTLITTFSYEFTFNSTTDLTGVTFPTFSSSLGTLSPPVVSGRRADFLKPIAPVNEILLFETFAPVGPIFPSSISGGGALIVQYNYTPAVAAAPEPGTVALAVLALAAGFGFTRRKRIAN